MATGFVYDKRFLDHNAGAGHPERPERLMATMSHLENQSWFASLKQFAPRAADREWVENIHSGGYIDRAAEEIASGVPFVDTPDVGVSRESFDVALLAAGGTLELADRVVSREVDNGFALVRPPGHHAEVNAAMGFCLFNNVAITARYLQKKHGLDKIVILDWDVHHGNGTQHSFEEDPSVLYVSLHQFPFYPGTGAYTETGVGQGAGATLNCPMPAGCGDADYQLAFTERIMPKIDEFKPSAVLISAGFDAHRQDPLAQINLSTEFYAWMSERLLEAANKHANGILISMLEGGYSLEVIALCVEQHLKVLAGIPRSEA